MILVFSGTLDGKELVYKLLANGFSVTASTATEYGKSLYDEHDRLDVYSHRLNKDEMVRFIKEQNPKTIIDTSHPYAIELRTTIVEAVKELGSNIPLLRYEREEALPRNVVDSIISVDSYEEAAKQASLLEGNVLLTTGSKTLDIFAKSIDVNRLIPRILPKWEQVRICEELGVKPSNIIAIQGPFSKELNIELIDKYNAKIMITKESGNVGGTLDKVEAAMERGLRVILIKRPRYKEGFDYYFKVDDLIRRVGDIRGE